VLNPADTKELFFVADGTGRHVFAETIKEHNANVQKWRAAEKGHQGQGGRAPGPPDETPTHRSQPPAEPAKKPKTRAVVRHRAAACPARPRRQRPPSRPKSCRGRPNPSRERPRALRAGTFLVPQRLCH
jgi:UPF0755 protein